MRICVCGWYFEDDFYASLWRINAHPSPIGITYSVFIIAHRDNELLRNCDLPYLIANNIGLEWGAYGKYLNSVWDGNESVLFMHDDIKLLPLVINGEIRPGEFVFNKLSEISYDQAFIFQDRREDVSNYGRHGRMIFFSERVLRHIKEDKNFPWLKGKEDVYFSLKEIQANHPDWQMIKKIYTPSIDMGYEGQFGESKEAFIQKTLRIG